MRPRVRVDEEVRQHRRALLKGLAALLARERPPVDVDRYGDQLRKIKLQFSSDIRKGYKGLGLKGLGLKGLGLKSPASRSIEL